MIRRIEWAGLLAALAICGRAAATEPNETFATATVLGAGVLSVNDSLTAGAPSGNPDTFLGIANMFGDVYYTDDDGSPLGDGRASGVGGVPTNNGSIDFYVTGYPDEFFEGLHDEQGQYEVFVDVYDFFGDPVDSFSEIRTLEPGVVHSFNYFDFDWIGGDYDVYIDNTIGVSTAWDVDFFRFTGLTAGLPFTARTTGAGTDTFLGWFSAGGVVLDTDNDSAGNNLSLISGIVPAGGALTFAVTGSGDAAFNGTHSIEGNYGLVLEIGGDPLAGDYNDDGRVDAADYTVWRNNLGDANENDINNAGNGIGGVTLDDYTWWKQRYGNMAGAGGLATAVPEPAGGVLAVIGCLAAFYCVRRTEHYGYTTTPGICLKC